jgi:hypothetical protein
VSFQNERPMRHVPFFTRHGGVELRAVVVECGAGPRVGCRP